MKTSTYLIVIAVLLFLAGLNWDGVIVPLLIEPLLRYTPLGGLFVLLCNLMMTLSELQPSQVGYPNGGTSGKIDGTGS